MALIDAIEAQDPARAEIEAAAFIDVLLADEGEQRPRRTDTLFTARSPRSSGDTAPPSGGGCAGSNPAGGTFSDLQLSLRVTRCHSTLVSLGNSNSSHDPLHGPYSSNRCPRSARVAAAQHRSIASLDHIPTLPGVKVDEARLADVCARYGIARLRVFGSVARGTATPDSDIDVLYELEPGRRLGWEIEQLADELQRSRSGARQLM